MIRVSNDRSIFRLTLPSFTFGGRLFFSTWSENHSLSFEHESTPCLRVHPIRDEKDGRFAFAELFALRLPSERCKLLSKSRNTSALLSFYTP